jgi:hypothetical protein
MLEGRPQPAAVVVVGHGAAIARAVVRDVGRVRENEIYTFGFHAAHERDAIAVYDAVDLIDVHFPNLRLSMRWFGGEPLSRLSRIEVKLKGDVVGSFSRERIRALGEKADLTGHDFGPVALAAAVLGFVLAGSQPTLDVNLTAFAQEPLARIGQLSECDDPMPIGALLLCTVAVRKPLRCRQREIRHVLP